MKLSECKIGEIVITTTGEVGYIEGLGYAGSAELIMQQAPAERLKYTIPRVKFPHGGTVLWNPINLQIYKD